MRRAVRPMLVEVVLGLGQDVAQVPGVDDEDPVQGLPAYAAHPPFHDRVHSRRLRSGQQDRNTASKASVNSRSRSLIVNLISAARSPSSISRLWACCATHVPVVWAVIPRTCTRRVVCSTTANTYSRARVIVSRWKKSHATILSAWALRNCPQLGPATSRHGIDTSLPQDRPHG